MIAHGVNRWEVDPEGEIVFFCTDGSWYELAEIHDPGTPYNVAVEAKGQLRKVIQYATDAGIAW